MPSPTTLRQHRAAWPTDGGGLHETVARIAACSPGSVALRAGDQAMSYAELDDLSTRWAADLASVGVGPGERVPILLPRSVDLVVALLAVLKTGAAYALLDPRWPRPHLESVIGDLGATVLIDEDPAGDPPLSSPEVRLWTPPADPVGSATFRPAAVRPADPCCVFFTSGTTGRPKGVLVPHRAISRLFVDGTVTRVDHHTVITLAAATPWDAFALELWGGLLRGGTIVVIEEPFLTPDLLRRVIAHDGVNTVWLTSSLFNMIVDEDLAAYEGLSQVLVGGERLSVGHVRRFLERHSTIDLTNGYGPVESTIFASTHRVMPMDHLRPGGIPLGICVPSTRVFVLDGDRQCGRDEEGEICITGDGLAIEYLGDPELTAKRFATFLLDGQPTRVYRTGDLGAWRSPDGLLEFRGRADRQLKVRGHRVEPAEVEQAILDTSSAVADCHVLPRPTARGDSYELVAFCVPQAPGDQLHGLSDAIAARLPAYQRPSELVVVEEFPLNDRGKISEAQLLEQSAHLRQRPGAGTAPAEAAGAIEDVVAETFAHVLGMTSVPHDASFFALGGTSLDAGRLCARLGHRTGTSVPLSRFYRLRSVAALASWFAQLGPDEAAASQHDDRVPLAPVQTAFLLRDVVQPGGRTNHCLLAWRVDGPLDIEALDRAVVRVHERHEALRAEYTLEPRPHARVVDIEAPELKVLPPESSIEAAVASLTAELAEPFDPECGEVWRPAVVPVMPGEVSVFGCGVHHVAFDGWSEAVLAEDLSLAYAGRPAAPPPPPLAQLARHRQVRARQADVGEQVSTLAAALRGVPDVVWPAHDPTADPARVGVIHGVASPASSVEVAQLARSRGTTRFCVLLTAWGWALAEVIGVTDVAVGVPVADRALAGDERAIGCQVATVPIRLRGPSLRPDGEFTAAVEETTRQVEEAFGCQDAPLDQLVEMLGLPASGRTPIFQMMFALQDNRTPKLRLNGLSTTHLALPYLDIPTDLHCEVWPTPEGGLLVEMTFKPESVSEQVAHDLLRVFLARVEQSKAEPGR